MIKWAINRSLCYFRVVYKLVKSMLIHLRILFLSLILSLLFQACASAPRFVSRDTRSERIKPQREDTDRYRDANVLESIIGVASYYADEFNGRIAYSGEVYNMYDITAAHPTYPMDTIVRVTNLSNNKSIIVRINDRMPYRPDRIIDLSLGCAQELEMVQAGITEVKVEVIEWGKGKK